MSSRRRRLVTPEESKLWRTVMKDAVPYPGRLEDDAQPETAPPAPPASEADNGRVEPPVPPPLPPPSRKTVLPHLAHGASPGVDRRTAERLHRGDMAIDGRIDLHGLTQDGAHAALYRFILSSADQGRRCVLVITGKGNQGTGVLRGQVPRWLNDASLRPAILSFSYAKPKDGGGGALYVLLKRRR